MTKNTQDPYLGTISSEIVGRQYYEDDIRLGERAFFEREPGNQYDRLAIAVLSEDHRTVGHLPRRLTSWLAPLIDAGQIRIEGRVPIAARTRSHRMGGTVEIVVELYQCAKGDAIFDPIVDPTNELDALHDMVRHTYQQACTYNNPAIATALAKRLDKIANREVLPQTKLLLALFPFLSESAARKMAERQRANILAELELLHLGQALHFHNLTLFPLAGKALVPERTALLGSALQAQKAIVQEREDDETVGEVILINNGLGPLLGCEGEILIGAKQNRVLNYSFVVPANQQVAIPVCCVEQDRWSYNSPNFAAAEYAPAGLRARRAASLRNETHNPDDHSDTQSLVWANVDKYLADLEVDCQTRSITTAYGATQERLKEYRRHLPLPAGTRGFLISRGDQVVGLEVYESPAALRSVWKRLSQGYFLDAAVAPEAAPKTTPKNAQVFLEGLTDHLQTIPADVGAGQWLTSADQELAISGAWYEGGIRHLSAFTPH